MVYRTLTGNFDALSGFLFCSIGENVHNNALPIFACVKIRGDKITTGKLLGERHSLADVRSYRTSQEDLPNHLIQFTFSEKYWPNRFSLIIDKDDADTLSNYLKARDIVAVAAISELVALSV